MRDTSLHNWRPNVGLWLDCLSLVPSDRQRSHEPVEDTTFFSVFFLRVLSP